DAFQINTCNPGAVEGHRVAHQVLDRGQVFSLHLVAAHHVHRLRSQTDVSGNRDFGVDDAANQVGALFAAFYLHRFGARFFHVACTVAHRLIGTDVVGPVGHVRDEECMLDAATHGFGVVQHLVDGDRERVLVAKHGHGKRVADQDDVDAGRVDDAGGRVVVGG